MRHQSRLMLRATILALSLWLFGYNTAANLLATYVVPVEVIEVRGRLVVIAQL